MTYVLTVLADRPSALWDVAGLTDVTGNGFSAVPTGSPATYGSLAAGGEHSRVVTNATPVAFEAPIFGLRPFSLEIWIKLQNITGATEVFGQDNVGIFASDEQISGKIELSDDTTYEVSKSLDPWKTAMHVVLTFDNRSLELFVDGESAGALEILEQDIGKSLKQQTVIDTLYSGPGATELIIDYPAVYGTKLTGDIIKKHFTAGRKVMNADQIVAQSGGNFIRLSDNNADIYFSQTFETDVDWALGTYSGVNIDDGRLVSEVEAGVTIAGEWLTSINLSNEDNETVDVIKLGWLGEGVSVEVSEDNTTWSAVDPNEPLVAISIGEDMTDYVLSIKVIFASGLTEAYLRRLRVIAYRSRNLVGERGLDAIFTPAVLTEKDFEPIQDYDDRGIQEGPVNIPEDPDWQDSNLVRNGYAEDGNNNNFSGATFNADAPVGASGSFLVAAATFEADDYITVIGAENIQGEFSLKQSTGATAVSAGFAAYDVDQNRILPENFMYYSDTTTVMSSDLTEGDTIVYLDDVTNYPNTTVRSDESRGFIFWNNPDYPDYSRNVYANLWSSGDVDTINNTITLDAPWAGPTIFAGTRVNSYRSSGDTIIKFLADGVTSTGSWVQYTGNITEQEFVGDIIHDAIWPGTTSVRPAWTIAGGTGQLIGAVGIRVVTDDPRDMSGLELWVRFDTTPAGVVADNGDQLEIVANKLEASAGSLIINGNSSFTDNIVPYRWYHVIWEFSPRNVPVTIGGAGQQIGQIATYEESPPDSYDLYQGLPSLVINDISIIDLTESIPEVDIYAHDWTVVTSE